MSLHQENYPSENISNFYFDFHSSIPSAPEEVADDGSNASLPPIFEFRIILNLCVSLFELHFYEFSGTFLFER